MMLTTTNNTKYRLNPREIWYAPDKCIRTKDAAQEATNVVQWIRTRQGLDQKPDEGTLFFALHACGYRAARKERGKPVSDTERFKWAERWQDIRDYIVEENMGLVYSMISKVGSSQVDEDEMLSEGLYGLSRAVERFNPWKGYRFSTYACNAIARSMMRKSQRETRYRERFPVQHDLSLDKPQAMPDFQTELYSERLHRALEKNLAELTDHEYKILKERFPLDDRERRRTLKEIGDSCGVSKERVRQLQSSALKKIREALNEDPILQ